MVRGKISKLIEKRLKDLQKKNKLNLTKIPNVVVEYSKEKMYGDYGTNVALQLSRILKRDPVQTADFLASVLACRKRWEKRILFNSLANAPTVGEMDIPLSANTTISLVPRFPA